MKIKICFKERTALCYILYHSEKELEEIEKEYSEFGFFVTDECEFETLVLPIRTVNQFTEFYL